MAAAERPDPSTPSTEPDGATASEALRAAYERWSAQTLAPALGTQPERKAEFKTEALRWPVKRLYTPLDLEEVGFDYQRDLGFPGQAPFTRSTNPTGYRQQLWTPLQTTGFGTGRDANQRWRKMLEQGLGGIIIEYDLPTTNGYDSDHPLASGEVCRAGVACDSLPDMIEMLDLPFDRLQYMTSVCNGPQPVNLAMILAALEHHGVDPASFTLQMPNAILIEFTCVGRWIYPPDPSLRIATDVIEYTIRNHPNWIPVSIVGAQMYAARANPVQELAFSFSMAMTYIDSVLERGFTIDEVAPYFSFITGIDMDFFESVAKMRVYRKVWTRLMQERYGATSDEALRIRLMGSPGTMPLTLQQPLNNIARLGMMMMACALGTGGEQMNTPLYDEAHALPTDDAVQVGAAIQHIVAHETGVADTVDPLAGSYYLETLTKRMEDAVMAEIEKIDSMGGALEAIKAGYLQRKLAEEQWERNKQIENGERKIVGINHLTRQEDDAQIELFRMEDDAETRQLARLAQVKAERDATAVERTLAVVRAAAEGSDNLVPPIMDAVKAHATLGEICDVMRDVFGEYRPEV